MTIELALLIAFLYSVILAILPILYVVNLLWEKTKAQYSNDPDKYKRDNWLPLITGIIDRSIYLFSLLSGKPEFIVVWLGLKTVAIAPNWKKETDGIPARAVFNIFIIGNGLCVLFSFAGASFVFSYPGFSSLFVGQETLISSFTENIYFSLGAPSILFFLTYVLGIYIDMYKPDILVSKNKKELKIVSKKVEKININFPEDRRE